MYADNVTDSMALAIEETRRRRELQIAWNEEHGIEPQTIRKAVNDIISFVRDEGARQESSAAEAARELAKLGREESLRIISSLEEEMAAASETLDFETAARLRDQIVKLRAEIEGAASGDVLRELKKTARKGSAHGSGGGVAAARRQRGRRKY